MEKLISSSYGLRDRRPMGTCHASRSCLYGVTPDAFEFPTGANRGLGDPRGGDTPLHPIQLLYATPPRYPQTHIRQSELGGNNRQGKPSECPVYHIRSAA